MHFNSNCTKTSLPERMQSGTHELNFSLSSPTVFTSPEPPPPHPGPKMQAGEKAGGTVKSEPPNLASHHHSGPNHEGESVSRDGLTHGYRHARRSHRQSQMRATPPSQALLNHTLPPTENTFPRQFHVFSRKAPRQLFKHALLFFLNLKCVSKR